jgi:hypothetical protein
LYTKHQNGFNCGKYITDIPGYFNYVNIILKLYFVITKRYCALIALWKPRRISSQTKHECRHAAMSHCQLCRQCSAIICSVYVEQRKQWWSHVKILTPKQYEYNL